jgi:hypothetical protein
MILDEQSLFSNNQIVNVVSNNILDLGKREVSFGTPIELFIMVTETFDNLTSLKVEIQTATDEEFINPLILAEYTVLLENLKKGDVIPVKFFPKGNLGYVRLYYAVNGTTPTTGKILAGIVDSQQESYHNV